MIVNFSKKYCFVGVPRTGSTSIHNLLLNVMTQYNESFFFNDSSIEATNGDTISDPELVRDLKHATFQRIVSMFPAAESFKSFCFVRNPHNKIASDHAHLFYRRIEKIPPFWYSSEWPWHRKVIKFKEEHSSLNLQDSFAKYLEDRFPDPNINLRMFKFFTKGASQNIICKFENFSQDLIGILNSFDYETGSLEIPHSNSNNISDYSHAHSHPAKEIIYNIFKQDFIEYGYEI